MLPIAVRKRLVKPSRAALSLLILVVVSLLTVSNWNEKDQHKDLHQSHRRLSDEGKPPNPNPRKEPLKILYTVTTLAEYDTGQRSTSRGFDRLQELVIPVITEGVESMLSFGYHVDVYLVCHYEMKPERLALIRNALPESVSIRVWDDASPINYDTGTNPFTKLLVRTISLARQHRFVVKDNLFQYDFFLNFEDDMVLKGYHVQQYLEMTQQLYRLRELAPETSANSPNNYFGEMTKSQLERVFPGLIRVEVLLDEDTYGAQSQLDAVPLTDRPRVDPQPCCHMSKNSSVNDKRPASPDSDKMFLWETNIAALGVRQMPVDSELGWVLMQRGPGTFDDPKVAIGDYWSGTDKYFSGTNQARRPGAGSPAHINNQGGWMATRQQIWEWHTNVCLGGFLPPFEAPHYRFDGLDLRNVEYWSGGLQLVMKRHACNMQRIISLEPDKFARHLLYHSSNNKQRQLTAKKRVFTKVNDLLGQLNTVRNNALQKMQDLKP